MNHKPTLSDIFTPSQQSQLAILLAELMALGHGSLEITVVDHRPKFFSSKRSYRACPVADQQLNNLANQGGMTNKTSKH
jgi:hypothetical protein